MRRIHDMPFGALLRQGAAQFRLWAPSAESVELLLYAANDAIESIDLPRSAEGWCEHRTTVSSAVTHYAYRIDRELVVPDPAARFNPEGVHRPSALVDPAAFIWKDSAWQGRPWEEAVLYELHVGTFTPHGTFAAIIDRLATLADVGITALELMPVATFAGKRGWGYDGVLPFAPHPAYGTPDDLKRLIQAVHARGLMIILDVVYNHFGPEGNYLGCYARDFFNPAHQTPWGAAINLDGPHAQVVRDYFLHNALYWLEEFHFDGLRLDAVHALRDDSPLHFVEELAQRIKRGPGSERHVHLILENNRNQAKYLTRAADGAPLVATAQWNDDFHHPIHVLATGETEGYYADYSREPISQLGRAMAEGFVYQGERSEFEGATRGEPSRDLPPVAMINFLQTHDQIGNRACGERLAQLTGWRELRAAYALLLLHPGIPMLFMGEEWATKTPFLYFCDFAGELGVAVTAGRRKEFSGFVQFGGEQVPDPNAESTMLESRLDWIEQNRPEYRSWRDYVRELLALRREWIVPLIPLLLRDGSRYRVADEVLTVEWSLSNQRTLRMNANFGAHAATLSNTEETRIFATHPESAPLPSWGVVWSIGSAA
jgi:malto-oligosyltrehalose trehalohydrolase